MSGDHPEIEPIAGLPGRPPEGEDVLWQGKPNWWGLALRVFHIRKVAAYFAILVAWRGITAVYDGADVTAALLAMADMLPLVAVGLLLLAGLAKLYARTTIFTITNRRVVMRYGVALSMAVNFPFSKIDSAALRLCKDGTGDLPLTLRGKDKIAYLHLWPFARPGRYRQPQPMLRAVPDAFGVAELLGDALKQASADGLVHTISEDPQEPAAAPVEPGLALPAR